MNVNISDASLELSVQLGSKRMSVKEVLSIGSGTIITLDQQHDAPVLILANGKPIAYGEVVSVDNDYGVRITQILK